MDRRWWWLVRQRCKTGTAFQNFLASGSALKVLSGESRPGAGNQSEAAPNYQILFYRNGVGKKLKNSLYLEIGGNMFGSLSRIYR